MVPELREEKLVERKAQCPSDDDLFDRFLLPLTQFMVINTQQEEAKEACNLENLSQDDESENVDNSEVESIVSENLPEASVQRKSKPAAHIHHVP